MSQSPNDLVLTIKSRVDDESFSATGQRVRDNMVRGVEEAQSGLRAHIEKLNETFGRSSTFGHALHAAGGGGALFAFGELGRMFQEAGQKARELSEQVAEGKLHGEQLVDQVARGIPLLGAFYSGVRDISDALSGEAEIQKQIAESAKDAAEFRKQEFEFVQKRREVTEQLLHQQRDAQNAAANVYLEGPSSSVARLQQGIAGRQQDREENLKKVLEAAGVPAMTKDLATRGDQIAQLKKEANAANAAVAAQNARLANFKAAGPGASPYVDEHLEERAKALNDRLATLQGDQAAQKKRHDDLLQTTTDNFNKANKDKDAAAQTEIDRLREQRNLKREADTRATEQRITDITNHASEERLRANHQYYEADLIQLKDGLNKKVEALAVAAKANFMRTVRDNTLSIPERIRQAGADLGGNFQELGALYGGFSADSEQARKNAAKQEFSDRVAQEQELSSLVRQRIEDLSREAAAGNQVAAIERDRLEIAEQFNQRRLELQRIMHSDTADMPTKLKAFGQLFQSYGQEAEAQQLRIDESESHGLHAILERLAAHSPVLARQLRQHDIKKQYGDQAAQLQGILSDKNATAAQKAAAQAALDALGSAEQGDLFEAGKSGHIPPRFAPFISNAGGRLTGADLAERSRAFLEEHDGKHTKEAHSKFDQMIDLLSKIEQAIAHTGGPARRQPPAFLH